MASIRKWGGHGRQCRLNPNTLLPVSDLEMCYWFVLYISFFWSFTVQKEVEMSESVAEIQSDFL